jgi:hypothetical protein
MNCVGDTTSSRSLRFASSGMRPRTNVDITTCTVSLPVELEFKLKPFSTIVLLGPSSPSSSPTRFVGGPSAFGHVSSAYSTPSQNPAARTLTRPTPSPAASPPAKRKQILGLAPKRTHFPAERNLPNPSLARCPTRQTTSDTKFDPSRCERLP